MRFLRNFARLLIAPVFIFAGFVKLIDPLGFTYKFTDYFEAWQLDFLIPLAFGLAILLSAAELMIGTLLLFKIRMKETAWALMVFMGFFTLFTFIIALTNPVTDCGCFGDALILTNWQTFLKNLIFLVPTILVFYERQRFYEGFSPAIQWGIAGTVFIASVWLSVHCYRTLPPIDFRPYKIGTDIPASMEIPEGEPVDRYESILVYEKDGVKKEFTLESPEAPWSDSSWTWVETRNILVEKGYVPPIHDFSLTSLEGEDITSEVLYDGGYSLLVVAYDLDHTETGHLQDISAIAETASEYGVKTFGMTSSGEETIREFTASAGLSFEFYITDEITLKTMIRSNPGLMLIHEGVILGKWPGSRLPDEEMFTRNMLSESLSRSAAATRKRAAVIAVLVFSLIFLLTFSFRLIYDLSEE